MNEFSTPKNPLFGRLKFNVFRTRVQCAHGPKSWPWWKWFAIKTAHLQVCLPSTGRSIWLYTRWGAVALYVTVDRRGMGCPEGRGW